MAVFEFGREGIDATVRVIKDEEPIEVPMFVDTSEEGLAKFFDLQEQQEKAEKKLVKQFPNIENIEKSKENYLKMIDAMREITRGMYDELFGKDTYDLLLEAGLSVFQTRDLFEKITSLVEKHIDGMVAENQNASAKAKADALIKAKKKRK